MVTSSPSKRVTCDLAVVGAGPTGLFATYYAGFRGLSVVVLDSQDSPGGQVAALYPMKKIHDVAAFPSVSGTDLVNGLVEQAQTYGPRWMLGAGVVDVTATDDPAGGFDVTAVDGRAVRARAVLFATGLGGTRPRTLPAARGWTGRGVAYGVGDPDEHAGEDVVIVGGGDTAFDWAIELRPVAASVSIIHRRRTFRAHAAQIDRARDLGVHLLTEQEIVSIDGDDHVATVTVQDPSGARCDLAATTVIGALGVMSAPPPFEAWGVEVGNHKVVVDSSMQTGVPGLFAAGDAVTLSGKVALMVTGFGDAATAVNNAAVFIDPDLSLIPGHSTDF